VSDAVQIRDAFADLNVEPTTSVLHGRKGLTPTIYVAPFLTAYAGALGQARPLPAAQLASLRLHHLCGRGMLMLFLAQHQCQIFSLGAAVPFVFGDSLSSSAHHHAARLVTGAARVNCAAYAVLTRRHC